MTRRMLLATLLMISYLGVSEATFGKGGGDGYGGGHGDGGYGDGGHGDGYGGHGDGYGKGGGKGGGTSCVVKGSYCRCHYCKCEHGHLHCGSKKGGYGHEKG